MALVDGNLRFIDVIASYWLDAYSMEYSHAGFISLNRVIKSLPQNKIIH